MHALLVSDLTIDDGNSSEASEEDREEQMFSENDTDEEDDHVARKDSSNEDEEKDGIVEEFGDGSGGGEVGSDATVEDFGGEILDDTVKNVRRRRGTLHDDPDIYEELVKQEDENKMGSTEKQVCHQQR